MSTKLAPAMELQGLSGNWKKLQAKLVEEDPNPRKRKASEGAVLERDNLKRHKPKSHIRSSKSSTLQSESTNHTMGHISSNMKNFLPSASLALWAEDNDISAKDLHLAYGAAPKSTSASDPVKSKDRINEGLSGIAEAGKYVAIDCEMVGVGPDPGLESALARVSIVNYHGHQLYDSFVQVKEPVTDYRTFVSGITPELLQSARSLESVQVDVAMLLGGKILIGHAIRNDLDALLLGHPRRDIRDTSRHPAFRQLARGKTPGLKKLAREVLGIEIQSGEHSSIEDARATMLLFRREKANFENDYAAKWGPDRTTSLASGEHGMHKRNSKNKKKKTKK